MGYKRDSRSTFHREDYYGEERIVDTHIKNIRKKLGVNLISTIRGVGYRIDKEN